MKKIILVVFACLMTCRTVAQGDDLCLWSTVIFDKSFGKEGKWSAGLLSEYRHRIHNGVDGFDQYFLRPRVAYKVKPWLNVRYQMDFASTAKGFQFYFIPEVTFSHKAGDFTFALRQRVMTNLKVQQKTSSTVLRTRAKVDYHIPKSPMSVHFAVEPYWSEFSRNSFAWFQKARWYAGFNIKLADGLYMTPEYLCQAYHNHSGRHDRRTYDDHVIYMTFTIKL